MDPQQLFSFSWNNPEHAYNDQVHGVFAGPSQLAPGSSTFSTSYQTLPQQSVTNFLQSDDDVIMEGGSEPKGRPAPSGVRAEPDSKSSRRAKTDSLNWDAHKTAIKTLYIDQNKSLSETRESMDRLYSFKAS